MSSNTSLLKDYEVLETIGRGSYGCCRKVRRRKDGRILVWKELFYGEMTETEKQLVVSEVNILREFRHPNIVRYYDRIVDRNAAVIYIVMEYCEGGDLSSFIKRCKERGQKHGADESFVWRCLTQLCSALRECHCRSVTGRAVLHRDLKPANVFLDRQNNVKLGDFGLARVLQHDNSFAKTFVGTPYYMSPEQMYQRAYNEKSDIWSLGCLIYEICALRPPFLARNQRDLAVRIKKGQFSRLPSVYSDKLQALVETMLQVNEAKRPTIESLYQRVHAEASGQGRRNSGSSTDSRCPHCGNDSSSTRNGDSGEFRDSSKERQSAIKRREEDVYQKEAEIKKRLLDLSKREKAVSLMEKVAEDKMKKADSLLRERNEMLREVREKAAVQSEPPAFHDREHGIQSKQNGTVLGSLGDFSPDSSPPHSPWNLYRRIDSRVTKPCLKKDMTSVVDSPRDSTPRKTVTFHSSGMGFCPLGLSPTSPTPLSVKKRKADDKQATPLIEGTDENVNPYHSASNSSANAAVEMLNSRDGDRRALLRQRWERAKERTEMLEKLEKEIIERCQTVLQLSSESN